MPIKHKHAKLAFETCAEDFVNSVAQDSSDEELEYCKRVSKSDTSTSRGTAPAVPKRKVGRPRKYPREDGADEPTAKKPKLGASRSSLSGTTVTNKL